MTSQIFACSGERRQQIFARSNMMFLTPVKEGFHFWDFNVVQILFSGERAGLTHIRRIFFVCLDMWRGGNMLPHAARLIFPFFNIPSCIHLSLSLLISFKH